MSDAKRIEKMMQLRARVSEALHSAGSPPSAVNESVPTIEQEQVIATYVLALMIEDVAAATHKLRPT